MPDKSVKDQLLAFSDFDSRQFELEVGAFLKQHVDWAVWQAARETLVGLLEAGEKTATADEEKLRYAALYVLAMRARRLHQVDEFERYLSIYDGKTKAGSRDEAAAIRNSASYCHLKALFTAMKSGPGEMRAAIELAKKALEKCGGEDCGHSGIVHHLAELQVAAAEREVTASGRTGKRDLNPALRLAERAIRLEKARPYAKYFATRGRIRALLEDYERAEEDVKEAICNEGDSWDYPMRYADYRALLTQIELRRVQSELQRAQATFEESRTSQIELLGFFAGVLALVLAGVQMSQVGGRGESPAQALGRPAMLVLLTGCLLLGFAGLAVLLHGKRFWVRPLLVAALGGLLLAAGLMLSLAASA